MRTLKSIFFFVLIQNCLLASIPSIKIQGSTTVNPVVVEAAEVFRKKGWRVVVDTQGGSSGGISALGEGLISIAMSSRSLNESDKLKFPKTNFYETLIGYDGVAMVVSKGVFESGVKSLSKEQIKNIYEKKITRWSEVGGANTPIVFYNKEPGRGTWEVFAQFLYSDAKLAPHVSHPEVGGNEEGRSKVANHQSAITQLSASWANGSSVYSLGIKGDSGQAVFPSPENIYSGKYPLKRSLFLYTNGKPTGPEAELLSYLVSEEGQKLVLKHGYLPLTWILHLESTAAG